MRELLEIQEIYREHYDAIFRWYPGSAKIEVEIIDEYGRKTVIKGPVDKVLKELYERFPVPIDTVIQLVRENGNGRKTENRETEKGENQK